MNIKVEHNIPLAKGRGAPAVYPFDGMKKLGDSFMVPLGKTQSVRTAACQFAQRSKVDVKFTVRKNGTGYRCWRIK